VARLVMNSFSAESIWMPDPWRRQRTNLKIRDHNGKHGLRTRLLPIGRIRVPRTKHVVPHHGKTPQHQAFVARRAPEQRLIRV
jgi:hypothetical protein